MIVESVVELFFSIMSGVLTGFDLVGLPLSAITALGTILVYGTWVVGADVLAVFTAMIVGWWGIKFLVGIVVFVWELLPLT